MSKKALTWDQVIKKLGVKSKEYDEQYQAVQKAIADGKYKPRGKALNGKQPALPQNYWEPVKEFDDPVLREKLHSLIYIKQEVYRKHLDYFKTDWPYAEALNKFLSEREKFPPCSERERCYQIWGNEKFLSEKYSGNHTGQTLLNRCGITQKERTEKLKIYPTSEPLPQFNYKTAGFDKILIVENSDPFTACQKVLESKGQILGEDFGVIIYGGGKRAVPSFKSDMQASPDFIRDKKKIFYYWGDLDYEGIGIYNKVASALRKNGYKVVPWSGAYKAMLVQAESEDYYHLPNGELEKTKDGQSSTDLTEFLSHFDAESGQKIQELLASRRYIAQEILMAWALERMSENG